VSAQLPLLECIDRSGGRLVTGSLLRGSKSPSSNGGTGPLNPLRFCSLLATFLKFASSAEFVGNYWCLGGGFVRNACSLRQVESTESCCSSEALCTAGPPYSWTALRSS
jgi:hypothetical protein